MIRQFLLATITLTFAAAVAPDARAALCFQYTKSGGGVSVGQLICLGRTPARPLPFMRSGRIQPRRFWEPEPAACA
jgi:hypothetical protein